MAAVSAHSSACATTVARTRSSRRARCPSVRCDQAATPVLSSAIAASIAGADAGASIRLGGAEVFAVGDKALSFGRVAPAYGRGLENR